MEEVKATNKSKSTEKEDEETSINIPAAEQRLMILRTQTIDFFGTDLNESFYADRNVVQVSIFSYQNLYNHRLWDGQEDHSKPRRIITYGYNTPLKMIQIDPKTGKMKLIKESKKSFITDNLELDKRFIYLADRLEEGIMILNLNLRVVNLIQMGYIFSKFPHLKLKRNGVAFLKEGRPMKFVYQGPNNAYTIVRFKTALKSEVLVNFESLKNLFDPEFIEFTNVVLRNRENALFYNHVLRVNITIPLKTLLEESTVFKNEKEEELASRKKTRHQILQICHTERAIVYFMPDHPKKGFKVCVVEPDLKKSSFRLRKEHYVDFYHKKVKMISGAFGMIVEGFNEKKFSLFVFLKGWEMAKVLDIKAILDCYEWLSNEKLDQEKYVAKSMRVELRSGTRRVEVIGRKLYVGVNFYVKRREKFQNGSELEICKFVDLVLDLDRAPFVDEENDKFLVIRDNYTIIV